MTIQKLDYPGIGETLYSAVLDNGLELRVVPKKDFSTFYAAFATHYGGAHRRAYAKIIPITDEAAEENAANNTMLKALR